jgi:hypothetical protein
MQRLGDRAPRLAGAGCGDEVAAARLEPTAGQLVLGRAIPVGGWGAALGALVRADHDHGLGFERYEQI